MAQVKKKAVRDAILASAIKLFSRQGYNRTTLAAISTGAALGVGSIYSYFPSKLELLYEVYRPWFQTWFLSLETEVLGIKGSKPRLRRLLIGFWHDFPAQNPGLANSLMEALATEEPGAIKPDDLIEWTEARLTLLLKQILPADKAGWLEGDLFAHTLVMAQDGFIINYRLGKARDSQAVVARFVDFVLGA